MSRSQNRECVTGALHCHDFWPRQSYDSPRFVKSGCIGMILSSAVAPSWCTGVNRCSTVVILEESWWFGNLEDNATMSLNRLNSSGWIVLDCGRCLKPQLHCHDFGPRQSYDSPRFVESGCIGLILSSAVAPSWCTGVNRSSTVVILEESWWFGSLEDNATTSLNRLNSSGWIVLDCGRGLSRSSTVAGSGTFLVASW